MKPEAVEGRRPPERGMLPASGRPRGRAAGPVFRKRAMGKQRSEPGGSQRSTRNSNGHNNGTAQTVGPVHDLERHLPSEWWRCLFNSLYLKTDGDVVENAANTAQEVTRLLEVAKLSPDDRILDLCCGQGRHCMELARRGFRKLVGVDRSRYLIRLARKRARAEGLSVSFHEGDARRFRVNAGSFNCVALLGNSFGYFDREEDDSKVLALARRALRPGGTLVMDLADGSWMRDHFERRSWEWIDADQFVCRERSLGGEGRRLITREVVVHAERGVIADQFYAERLYSAEQMRQLLERVGFEDVTFHEPVTTGSDRNQDLGMLTRRMLVTAQSPADAVRARSGPLFRKVTVLLGDPTMPDSVKLNGHFNREDIETVERLKQALATLRDYEFEYLDRHESLLTDLAADPPDFVLNFCDEGYRNDAFMELHVPAYLEMLRIPYTGSSPSALGLCYDKAIVRAIGAGLEVPVPAETYYDPADQSATIPSAFPALVKPNYGDSSIGITADAVVRTPEQLVEYLRKLNEQLPGRPALIQEFLEGTEYSVGIVGNPGLSVRVLPVLEVDYSDLPPHLPRILGYESKWQPSSPYWTRIRYLEARIDEATQRKLADWSTLLFERLGCRDYARFDFRANASGELKLLEANPTPGWCWDGKFNLMAEMGGLGYADLLRLIIEAAQERFAAATRPAPRAAIAVG